MKKLLCLGYALVRFQGGLFATGLQEQLAVNLEKFYCKGGQTVEMAKNLGQQAAAKMINFLKNPEELQLNDKSVCVLLEAIKWGYNKDVVVNILKDVYGSLKLTEDDYYRIADRVAHRFINEYEGDPSVEESPADQLSTDYETLESYIGVVLVGYLQEYKE